MTTTVAMARPFVVVIDPGHGGKDFGAIGGKTNEKSIVLSVGKLLGQKIGKAFGKDEVEVVFTRDGDYFVTLQGRADIANKAKGDLFISIHANSVDKRNKKRKTINGTSVYTLGVDRAERNLAVAQRENSVIELENDYQERYLGFDPSSAESYIIFELEQNRHMEQSLDFAAKAQRELVTTAKRADKKVRQAGFWVLHATAMPAVLVELDFICNPTEEAFMSSKKGQEQLSDALFKAFKLYKRDYDAKSGQNATVPETAAKNDKKQASSEATTEQHNVAATTINPPASGQTVYCIQFLTAKKSLPNNSDELKGITDALYYKEKGLFKYYCSPTDDFDTARNRLDQIKKLFPDAFIIRMKGGKRVR